MAKKSKKTTKKNISPTKKSPHKQSSPKKKIDLQPKKVKKPRRAKKVSKKIKSEEEENLEIQREKIIAELIESEYGDLDFENDLGNIFHDIFDTYEEPSTEKENKEYIKKLINDNEVILYLLDARDVLYFLDKNFEKMINVDNKLLIYIINKIDLVSQNYLKKISKYLAKVTNKNFPKLFCSCLIREKIKDLYDNINFEILKFKTTNKTPKKKNSIVKIGIVGMPNVGKNSLVQSFELLVNSFCDNQYINFGGNQIFSVNSTPGTIYGTTENERLISRKYKNVQDIPDTSNLIKNLFKFVDKNKIKDIYSLNKKLESEEGLIEEIKKKFGLKNDKSAEQIILEDIISGKITYEMNY